jgi:multiple sugar transport system permease protein
VSVADECDTALGWSTGRQAWLSRGIRIALSTAAVLLFTGPLVTVFSGAFDHNPDPTRLSVLPNRPSMVNFEVAGSKGIWHYLTNSLVIAGGALLLQLAVSVFAAYALARKKFRGQAVVLLMILTTTMLPEEVTAIPCPW